LRDEDIGVRQDTALALGQLGDARAVGPLITALRDENSSVRWGIRRALERIGTPEALAALED
jgi:HEAT repeat protein